MRKPASCTGMLYRSAQDSSYRRRARTRTEAEKGWPRKITASIRAKSAPGVAEGRGPGPLK